MALERSLAELTLEWCLHAARMDGVAPEPQGAEISAELGTALNEASRGASRAAGVALLQAAAGELKTSDGSELAQVATVIESDDAWASLERRLTLDAVDTDVALTDDVRERGAFVGDHVSDWMTMQAGANEVPPRIQGWLEKGWPDARARGGVMTFYQAFCGALQRTVRQEQTRWDALLKGVGLTSAAWRDWLIREAEAGTRIETAASRGGKVLAMLVLVAALAAGAAWYWRGEIGAWISARSKPEVVHTEPAVDAARPIAFRNTTFPSAAIREEPEEKPSEVEPKVTLNPKAKSEPTASGQDPLTEATRLISEAEVALASDSPSSGDLPARSAEDVLSALPLTNNAALAESLSRVAHFWEVREDWAEAARLHQRAVKAYERTPAENANPQLQSVRRWANALHRSGRNTESERLYRTLLQAYAGLGSGVQLERAIAAFELGGLLNATGQAREARPFYAQALVLAAEKQGDAEAEPLIGRFKEGYAQHLLKLGVSQAQIEAEMRKLLGPNPPSAPPANR